MSLFISILWILFRPGISVCTQRYAYRSMAVATAYLTAVDGERKHVEGV